VVSAPSGCGKTTICKELTKISPKLVNSISLTTRPPRDNEVNGEDYYFVSQDEFLKMRKKRGFLEWACNFGHFYGTPRRPVEEVLKKGKDILLAIDVKGAKKVKKKTPGSVHIFLMPPSMSVLEKRLKNRGTDGEKEIKRRLRIAKREIAQVEKYDYVVVNDSVKRAVEHVKSIVKQEKRKFKK